MFETSHMISLGFSRAASRRGICVSLIARPDQEDRSDFIEKMSHLAPALEAKKLPSVAAREGVQLCYVRLKYGDAT